MGLKLCNTIPFVRFRTICLQCLTLGVELYASFFFHFLKIIHFYMNNIVPIWLLACLIQIKVEATSINQCFQGACENVSVRKETHSQAHFSLLPNNRLWQEGHRGDLWLQPVVFPVVGCSLHYTLLTFLCWAGLAHVPSTQALFMCQQLQEGMWNVS